MRSPRDKVIITCAVTGNLTTPEQTPHLPITPQQIAEACLGAADAGAAIVHIHVRDPLTGRPSMLLDHYVDVVQRIRARNPALILNITTGPGGRFVPSRDEPKIAAEGTTLMVPEQRVEHIAVLRPDICTLDLNTMNSGREVVINTPPNVRRMAKVITEAGVKPEIELFDSGDIALMRDLIADGTLTGPVLCSFVMGVRYGFQPAPETVLYARNLLPHDAEFTAIGIGKAAFTTVAQSYLAGGHVRVGLEDAVYLSRGQFATSNAEMVVKARRIVEDLGGEIATIEEARRIVGLPHPSKGAARERP
ncbi:3-keto-5-aminohexanoate cleavage protein [Bradyrhizobium sp. CCBAU 53421]|uniref:3-keto-5-aminohexanoate cleavage protein n=1 Tax=Bradyrhizobium sp. CCBAU 53421 TaxID=1325120 RepID=UPI00188CE5EC|nr:3-keto-5-aminohexanoate cleavage protein [Bradyrhizobium sp. CCBAU 53421]QOZ30804.1 3-keto-5-aminohexanoate cleavage protein [Bradyrhizobium sp. CCBAU 53421]